MGRERLGSPVDHSSGRDSHEHHLENPISGRQSEADELWDSLKAEIGYSSYADYMDAY